MEITIDDVKLLVAILQNLNYKIGDAKTVLPLYEKLKLFINSQPEVQAEGEEPHGPESCATT